MFYFIYFLPFMVNKDYHYYLECIRTVESTMATLSKRCRWIEQRWRLFQHTGR